MATVTASSVSARSSCAEQGAATPGTAFGTPGPPGGRAFLRGRWGPTSDEGWSPVRGRCMFGEYSLLSAGFPLLHRPEPKPPLPRKRTSPCIADVHLRSCSWPCSRSPRTTSWPRDERDWVGRFVADAVERVRERGVEVDVVGPVCSGDFGLAYGNGVVANAKRRPWQRAVHAGSMVRTLRAHAPRRRPRPRPLAARRDDRAARGRAVRGHVAWVGIGGALSDLQLAGDAVVRRAGSSAGRVR